MSGCPGGTTLASLDLSEAEQASELVFEEATTLDFWAEVDVTHANLSVKAPNSRIPAVYSYAIEVKRAEDQAVVFSKACNPFDVNVMRWAGKDAGVGEPSGRDYDGRINDCAVKLPAGAYRVSARLQPGVKDDSVQLKRARLHIRPR